MRGQYFSFDAIIASVIFMLAIVMLLGYWHSVKTFLDYQSGGMSREAMRIASVLFMPGFPEGVDCAHMKNLGFAVSWNDRRIRESTLRCAETEAESNGAWLKEKFGTSYNVTIKVDYDGSEIVIGEEPAGAEIVKMRRAGTVVPEDEQSQIATFDIYLYR